MRPAFNQMLPATGVVNTEVKTASAEEVGYIKEVVLDITHARIAYAVLELGGFMGAGEKLFAVP